mmetsp:Transcript_127947/g.250538  ORF Transcript_127947/g.250538 Transcript_127947/m.250538 type:complete len:286 (+) Transcript_127947:51-908(+)
MFFKASGEMPLPVSATSISNMPSSRSSLADNWMEPAMVNFAAFVTKLYSSWVILYESPSTMGNFPSQTLFTMTTLLPTKGRPLLSTAIWVMPRTSSMMSIILTGRRSMRSPPDSCSLSALAISMMLVTRSSKRAAQPFIMLSCRFCMTSDVPSDMEPLRPMMPCRGLRNSWPRTAVKRALRSFIAFIAATSVRSCPMAVMVLGSLPTCSMRARSICTGGCSGDGGCMVISTAPELAPPEQVSSAFFRPSLHDGSTMSKMLLPTASGSRMPEAFSMCSFQATTTPS